jgi:predicted nucleic acid-binding protein
VTPEYDPREALKYHHRNNAAAPINGHDDVGFWRESYWAQWSSDAVPIVVDANILHDCIGRSSKKGEPTALVTIANTRAARIYCATHVIDEFIKYQEVWAGHYRVSPAAYQDAFVSFYRPLVRTVPTDGLEEMLSRDELARLDILRVEDADDVPTATLAIALGALPITKDHAPWKAVHGARTDAAHLDLWLSRLMSIGDRAETEKLLSFTLAGVAAPGVAALHWGAKLYRHSPLAFGITATLIVGAAFCVPPPMYRSGWDAIKIGIGNFNDAIMTPNVQANDELQRELPPFPAWEDLVAETSRDAALARACLYRLARSRRTPATVGRIVEDLPTLGIGQEAPRVGKVLRRYPCFAELAPKWWQVGRPNAAR